MIVEMVAEFWPYYSFVGSAVMICERIYVGRPMPVYGMVFAVVAWPVVMAYYILKMKF